MSLEETCFKYVVCHLGTFPYDVLQRLPNVLRYKILLCLPITVIWRLEATSFIHGLDMEMVWRQLCDDRLAPQVNFYNLHWLCCRGTERCLNSSHDRGTMTSVGFPFVFHDCVVSNHSPVGSNSINHHLLSSRSLIFLSLWKVLYSAKSFSENRNFLTQMLFSSHFLLETGHPSLTLPSKSHCILLNVLNVPIELAPLHQPSLPTPAFSSVTSYNCYVNTLISFLALDCYVRPTILYVNLSYTFLIQQSAKVLHELLYNIDTLSLEYSSSFKCLLDAALHKPDQFLVLAIRGKGAATDIIHSAQCHKKLNLEFSFSGRNNSERELTTLITTLSQHITSLDITFNSLPEPSRNLAHQCLALVQMSHIHRLSLDGVLNAEYAKSVVTAYFTTPSSHPQRLEVKNILLATEDNFCLDPVVFLDMQESNDYWKLKSLCISGDSGGFSSWILGLSQYKMFSLDIVDYTANFDGEMINQTIQVEKFNLSISAAHKTLNSSILCKILMAVASPTLCCMSLDLNCRTSAGTSSTLVYLTLFLKEQSKLGSLVMFHIHIHGYDDINSDALLAFFAALFNLPFVAGLNFRLDCRNCDCNHSLVLVAWRQVGKCAPAHFYFRTSSIEWKALPTAYNYP